MGLRLPWIAPCLVATLAASAAPAAFNPSPPTAPVRLIFIHHSTGQNWMDDNDGGLAPALQANNYFVSDTNYGWGPADLDLGYDTIGDHTDIGHWYDWFVGPHAATYLAALYAESGRSFDYSRLATAPAGENTVVMFKSCFPNSNLGGAPGDPPTEGANPLRGESSYSEFLPVGNAKGIYVDLLPYFAAHQDKLFIVVTAPPLLASETSVEMAANARAFNLWLTREWLAGYQHHNVFVFDFYDVLTSNGGDPGSSDLASAGGNHHRFRAGFPEHVTAHGGNASAYAWPGDSHPTAEGGQKATGEFLPLLNLAYHCWQGTGDCPRSQLPGDVSGDGDVGVGDIFYLVNYLFAGGPGPAGPTDVTADGVVALTDALYLVDYLLAGGPAPL